LDRPAVRPLEIMPVRTNQGELLMVRDPLGIIEGAAVMVPDPILLLFMQMADGQTTTGEMAQKVTMATGQIMPPGIFEKVAQQLDEALLLQSERFVEALKKKYEAFMNSPVRPYRVFQQNGGDRLKMLKELGDEMRRHKMSSLSPPKEMGLPRASVRGVLSPHIDYQRGGEAYAWAYQALKEYGTGARTFIILGTSHRGGSHRFIATRKHYDTPFGQLETNQELLEEISKEFGGELFADEFLHADEHTVELNATYLRHTFADKDIKIVPILVSNFEEFFYEDGSPRDDEEIQQFCSALRTVLERHGDDVAIIGGVDFSHCGPEFGDEQLNEPEVEKDVENADRASLDAIESMDADKYFDTYRPDQNGKHVCSIGTVYCVMEALRGQAKARVLSYQQANSNDKSCLVSFASVAFTKEGAEEKPKSKIILLG
jgi:AmmeMemoRadiSam system protein B